MTHLKDFGSDHLMPRCEPEKFYEAMSQGWCNFLEAYRGRINESYKELVKKKPKCFPFMNSVQAVFLYENQSIKVHVFPSKKDSYEHKVLQFITLGESNLFHDLPSFVQQEKVKEIIGRKEEPLKIVEFKYGSPLPSLIPNDDHVSKQPEDLLTIGKHKGTSYADKNGIKAQKELDEQFDLLEFKRLVHLVGNEDFEYELGEAIEAYKHGLHLAAAATVSLALENLLRLIIVKKIGARKLPEKTYIYESVKVLEKNQLIEQRAIKRIQSFQILRNSSSHTHTGKTQDEDVMKGFLLIQELIRLVFAIKS